MIIMHMPCSWNDSTNKCGFEFDNLFGGDATGFNMMDIGSQSNCEATGGIWKEEKWTDPNGAIYTDTWCEMGFGIGMGTCSDSCWACEFQNNGSDWANLNQSKTACQNSAAGCVFYEDPHAFNNYGWCDMDFSKSGNCDQNCWDCWEKDQCRYSQAGCDVFTDPYNENMWWCDDLNVKKCESDCGMCWDPDNCGYSSAGCTWDTTYWFCKSQGIGGEGAAASEICFDGVDNDGDTFVDCGDPECMYDPFCGGSAVFGSNCMAIDSESSCDNEVDNTCIWITDNWNNSWCDMKGAQCWTYDDNETACNESADCTYKTMDDMADKAGDTFCEVNFTLVDAAQCWDKNESDCTGDCAWSVDQWCDGNEVDPWCTDPNNPGGWCDYKLFGCHQYDDDESACITDTNCGWQTDWFNPDWGWCEPICFTLNESDCNAKAECQSMDSVDMGWCEPTNTFKGCWDKEEEPCGSDDACQWVEDPFAGEQHGPKPAS